MNTAGSLAEDVGIKSACDALAVPRARLHEKRFVDQAPREVYSALLDEGIYLCSVRTMYRILEENEEARERRNQLRHPNYKKPEILATAPNQVWSWDITKFKGPVKWTYYYLYVILDIFSRYVVGWMVAHREKSALARKLIEQSCEKQGIQQDQLIVHADRGPSMTSKPIQDPTSAMTTLIQNRSSRP